MTFRRPKKPGSRAHIQRTEAQWNALRILQLRGLWHFHSLTGWRRQVARLLVDYELLSLGVETQTLREAKRQVEWDARLQASEDARRIADEEIPF